MAGWYWSGWRQSVFQDNGRWQVYNCLGNTVSAESTRQIREHYTKETLSCLIRLTSLLCIPQLDHGRQQENCVRGFDSQNYSSRWRCWRTKDLVVCLSLHCTCEGQESKERDPHCPYDLQLWIAVSTLPMRVSVFVVVQHRILRVLFVISSLGTFSYHGSPGSRIPVVWPQRRSWSTAHLLRSLPSRVYFVLQRRSIATFTLPSYGRRGYEKDDTL